jgi:serine/threonine-protein kinase
MARIFEVEVRRKYRRSDLPRRLALKVAKQRYQVSLVAEADFLCRFNHPSVVRIHPLAGYHRPVYAAREQFAFGWGWYYAMEVLDGGGLDRRLSRPTTLTDVFRLSSDNGNRLSVLEAVGIARQIAGALEHIHQQHVINLDIKPGNVLFRRRRIEFLRSSVPQAVLCDFGIARDPRYPPRPDLLGVATPEYVSPEQTMELGRSQGMVDARSDIFSLGVMLYEMLLGKLPFETIALIADPTYVPVPPRQLRSSVPPLLDEIIMRALAKNAAHRFQTATEMKAALQAVRLPLDVRAAGRRLFAGGALMACVAAGGIGAAGLVVPDMIPTRTPTVAPPSTEMPTEPPTAVHATPEPRPSATPSPEPTSTRMSTLTPTNTPWPTETPTVSPPGSGG